MESFGIIYKATNKVNGMSYVGRTTRPLKDRKYAHIYRAFNYNTPYKFHCAIREFGADAFEWTIIDYADSLEDSYKKEMYWIEKINTFSEYGYNMDKGGCSRLGFTTPKEIRTKQAIACGSKEFYVFDTEGKYIKTMVSLSIFAEEIKASPANVSSVIKGRKNSINGYILMYISDYTPELLATRVKKIRKRRKFEVYDIVTEEPIGIWDNDVSCSKALGIDRKSISKSLKGKTMIQNRYKFYYI